ncbi:hypothetical protein [uncultured Sulfitobacter sp.]|uniref:hypothetical protein n=1 Tax=uncultured Sulfitobacter sp. TaxID=191468 RepID=UPI002611F058|nr:hypothetical protein [uncultured Sulfitobacter sp.]
MLSKFILRATLTAAAFAGTASAASADELRVLMMDYAFFPETSYVQPGDVIVFENISGSERSVVSNNDTWSINDLADGATVALTITEGMPTKYFSFVPGGAGDTVDENGNVRVVGTMNFNGPPQAADD